MKKVFYFLFLFIFLSPVFLLSLHQEKLLTQSGVAVELACRVFEPGEIIIVSIKDSSTIKKAEVRFLGKKYSMGRDKLGAGLLAFVSIDLDIESGLYTLEVLIDRALGEWERVQKKIPLSAKEYPLKKLWVDERFVRPPPEYRERVEWEEEILRALYELTAPQWLGEGLFIIPSSGKVRPNFGERRIYNNDRRSTHGGLDISSPYGEPVIASNSGRVVLASKFYYAGKMVIIDHGLGLFTQYCHFSKIRVKRGDLVKKGDIIGEIGATGRVTGPHLHWGVKVFGYSIDPLSLLSLIFK